MTIDFENKVILLTSPEYMGEIVSKLPRNWKKFIIAVPQQNIQNVETPTLAQRDPDPQPPLCRKKIGYK